MNDPVDEQPVLESPELVNVPFSVPPLMVIVPNGLHSPPWVLPPLLPPMTANCDVVGVRYEPDDRAVPPACGFPGNETVPVPLHTVPG